MLRSPKLAYNVVLRMVEGLSHVGHVMVMDKNLPNIGFFKNLLSKGIYAIGIVRSNWMGLPKDLANTKSFKSHSQGYTLWRMHDFSIISCERITNLCFLSSVMHL